MLVAFSLDGRLVATGSDSTARLWELETGREMRRRQGHEDDVQVVAFSPDGRLVATGSRDGTALLLEVDPAPRFWRNAFRSNLRVCRDTFEVVVVDLTSDLDPAWAPEEACREAS